jgi:hypothetical protein
MTYINITIGRWKTVKLDVNIIFENGLESSAEQERAAPPEDPVQVKRVFHCKVAEFNGAVFL